MPGKGTVKGKIDNSSFSFIKQMPNMAVCLPSGRTKLFKQEHPQIFYTRKSVDGSIYFSDWSMKMKFKVLGSISIPFGSLSGE
ncbi:MAG: hypothetical protein HKN39_08085 [Flavobacteriales bacterium]|nr:hypothetical protein [Flavobacteriales bacterium]